MILNNFWSRISGWFEPAWCQVGPLISSWTFYSLGVCFVGTFVLLCHCVLSEFPVILFIFLFRFPFFFPFLFLFLFRFPFLFPFLFLFLLSISLCLRSFILACTIFVLCSHTYTLPYSDTLTFFDFIALLTLIFLLSVKSQTSTSCILTFPSSSIVVSRKQTSQSSKTPL